MTDKILIAKKLTQIEVCVEELKTLARPEEIRGNVREERFVKYTLQIAIQAALDAASHVVADERLGVPSGNRELFLLLASNGWIPAELASRLAKMAGFRNMLVHQYGDVDLDIVERILKHDLDDLLAFTAAIRARLS